MSNDHPYHPSDGAPPDPVSAPVASTGHADALRSNPYSTHYEQAHEPDLDASAPQLRSNELRRMNQKALLLLAAVVVLLFVVAYWMIGSATTARVGPEPRQEKVTIAAAPRAATLPELPRAAVPAPAAQPIPLAAPPVPVLPPPAATSQRPNLLERRISAGSGIDTGMPAGADGTGGNALVAGPGANAIKAQSLSRADTLMQRGTYIRCVLETRVISDIPGYSSCLVTEPVYSLNGHTLLLPKGSKILGSYQGAQDLRRVGIVWDRIITPTGIDVNMSRTKSPGMDNLGGAGVPGHYDAHWGNRIGAALLISMLSDAFKYEAAKHGPRTTSISNGVVTQQPFESNTARTVQNLAEQAVREAANRPPTITINQGTVIYVYVAQDVDFSDVVARF